jgi:hypothetical protein
VIGLNLIVIIMVRGMVIGLNLIVIIMVRGGGDWFQFDSNYNG